MTGAGLGQALSVRHPRHERGRPTTSTSCNQSVEPLDGLGDARAKFNENRAFINNYILEATAAGQAEVLEKIKANVADRRAPRGRQRRPLSAEDDQDASNIAQ